MSTSIARHDEFFSREQIDTPCKEWRGATNAAGYGVTAALGKTWLAHRLAWTIERGPIPEGMCVCHKCDNPSCFEVSHLFLGTHADNVSDKVSKHRGNTGHLLGEAHPRSKLTTSDVEEIRRQRKAGVPRTTVAKKFGISPSNVTMVSSGRTWK